MTPGELIQLGTGILFGVVIWSVAAERRMLRRMRLFEATTPPRAVPLGARTPVARLGLWRLLRSGAVIEPSPGVYYLDAERYERYRELRRTRAIMIMVLILLAITVLRRVLV